MFEAQRPSVKVFLREGIRRAVSYVGVSLLSDEGRGGEVERRRSGEETRRFPSLKVVAKIFDILGSESRLKVLLSLREGRKTWTELMFEHKMNPKILRDTLRALMSAGFVKKARPFGFELTVVGSSVLRLLLEPLITIPEDIKAILDRLLGEE